MASIWRNDRKTISAVLAFLFAAAWAVLILVPTDSFVIAPGSATDVSPFVRVGDIRPSETGDFLLTTISIREAHLLDEVMARFSEETELMPKERILAGGETEEEYERRQKENMLASQNHAVVAAFRLARRPVSARAEGVEVFRLVRRDSGGLRVGDLIRKVDGRDLRSVEELIAYLGTRRPGDRVVVELLRGGKPLRIPVILVTVESPQEGKPRAGLGIIPVPRVTVKTDPGAEIRAEEIGGPSAGLMFSLEVLDRLLPQDLTKGYRIAGTGTISDAGEVGQIGGIRHKIIAAWREGAQIFLCPRDIRPGDDNERTAKETVRRLGLHLNVVPVSTLEEAVRFLERLPPRKSGSFKSKTLTDALRVAYN